MNVLSRSTCGHGRVERALATGQQHLKFLDITLRHHAGIARERDLPPQALALCVAAIEIVRKNRQQRAEEKLKHDRALRLRRDGSMFLPR
jgi:hypothetical protein